MMRMMERPLSVGVLQVCAVLGAMLGVLYGLSIALSALYVGLDTRFSSFFRLTAQACSA